MSGDPRSHVRLTDRKHAAILNAAVAEFRSCGFDHTSMNRIAERAGVSKRTIYNHFKGKDELFAAIVQALIDRTEALPEFPYEPGRDLAEQLSAYGLLVVEMLTSEGFRGLVRVALSRFLMSPELARETIGDQKRFLCRLIAWIERADADGRLSAPDPEFAACQLCGLLEAFTFWPPLFGIGPDPGPDEQRSIVESATAMFLSHYAARPPGGESPGPEAEAEAEARATRAGRKRAGAG